MVKVAGFAEGLGVDVRERELLFTEIEQTARSIRLVYIDCTGWILGAQF